MGYLSQEELNLFGFRKIGKDVKISSKASFYDCSKIEIGDYSRIDDFCILSGNVIVGKFCHITPMCLVAGGQPGIFFNDFVTLAYGVKVFAQSDDYSGSSLVNSLIPKKFKKEIFRKVKLEKHVVIGSNCTIMPGVTIAEGCSIGAMSLVNKSTEGWGIYFGIPAKRIKNRSVELLKLEQKFLAELRDDTI